MTTDELDTVPAANQQDIDALNSIAEKSSDIGVIENEQGSDYRWKQFKLKVQSVKEDGTFEGYGSVFGNVDSDGEIIAHNACDRSIKNNPNFVILWNHKTDSPVGFCAAVSTDQKGLKITGELMLDCEAGRYALAFLRKAQKLNGRAGLSIGFKSIQKKWVEDPKTKQSHLTFTEIAVLEVSITPFPANPAAYVTAVKSAKLDFLKNEISGDSTTQMSTPVDFDSALTERQRQRELTRHRSDIESALHDTLSAIHSSDSDNETKKSMVADCYQQHAKAMTNWHVASYLNGTAKSFDVDLYRKGVELPVETKSAQDETEQETQETKEESEELLLKGEMIELDTKSGKHKLSAAAKAQLAHAMDMHKSAMDLNCRGMEIVKDMFGDDSESQASGDTEMGAMSDQGAVTETKSEDGKENSDSLGSFAEELAALTKSRLESLQ